jgi:putative oxidoreductase
MTTSALDPRSQSTSLTTYLPALGRLLIALIFLLSGVGKIFAPGPTQAYITAAGLPMPPVAYVLAIIVEVGGGLLLVLGYQTRTVALVLAAFTIATALGFHHNFADRGQMTHFLKNVAISGGLLQIFAFGGGGFSLDARMRS